MTAVNLRVRPRAFMTGTLSIICHEHATTWRPVRTRRSVGLGRPPSGPFREPRTTAVTRAPGRGGYAVRAVPVPFSASSAYTQRSLLHAYTTPSLTTGAPVISPPV